MEDTPVPVITDNDDMVFVSQEYLTIVTASGTHSGKYYCALSSSAGTVRSHDVFLNVWSELCKKSIKLNIASKKCKYILGIKWG